MAEPSTTLYLSKAHFMYWVTQSNSFKREETLLKEIVPF